MRLHDNCREFHISKRPPWTKKHGRKKMITGHIQIHPKRMALAVAVDAIQTLLT
jgi:hypothetical protein